MGDMVSLARMTCSTTTRCTTGGLTSDTVRAEWVIAMVSLLPFALVEECVASEDGCLVLGV